jgi:methyl-accepting chemotaxis protein
MKLKMQSRLKFSLLFLVVGLLPMILVSLIATYSGSEDIKQKVYNQLTAINQIKKHAIKDYFKARRNDMLVLSDTADTLSIQAFSKLANTQDLKKAQIEDYLKGNQAQLHFLSSLQSVKESLLETSSAFDQPIAWRALLDKYDTNYAKLLTLSGWHDFFLINLEGDIVYSVMREEDLGKNLAKDLTQSSFSLAFSLAKASLDNSFKFADYLPYSPSNNAPAAFGIKPITQEGQRIGYIAYQQPIEKINAILGHRAGMGETGESYLVGQDHLMRSDSYLNPENFSVVASFANQNKIQTKAVNEGLAGHSSTGIIQDYNNHPVLSSWDYIELSDSHRWALISEIDVFEALNPQTSGGDEYYQHYIEHYGYYDLLLIQPDGYVFYSVNKGAELHTNILNGPYADTNLSELIRQVSRTGHYGFVDFALYAPTNEPASFIAQPIKDNHGKTILYIALEMPTEGITNIMENRKGMGRTGESFLVGPDFKMRSNTYLDPIAHSIKASLSGNAEESMIDSLLIRQALAGKSGTDTLLGYSGNPVLSSYDRVKFENFNWAIVSEIDKAEAYASIYKYVFLICFIMFLSSVLIAILGYLVAK